MSQFSRDFIVGIDVASEFSYVAMLDPDGNLIRKAFRIDHTPNGFQYLLQIQKKEEERLNSKPIYFVESTGIYHLPLFFFLRSNDLKGFVLNPLCVHSTKNSNVRKVKNDKKDAEAIARLVQREDVKVSLVPEPQILSLRMLVREYFALADNLTDCKLRFSNDLHLVFPGFKQVFKDPFSAAALAVLEEYPSLHSLQSADLDKLTGVVAKAARRSFTWAKEKLVKLFDYASIADSIGLSSILMEGKLRIQIQTIQSIASSMAKLETAIRQQVESNAFPKEVRDNIELLDTMHGVGFISVVTLLAEIGDFSKFTSAKALAAFFGIDPTVKESGKFKGDRIQMSKRGTKLGRRVLYTIALASIRRNKKGDSINPILRAYYESKTASKKKKVALVAVMHKLIHYFFAVLRNLTNVVRPKTIGLIT
ncbi:Transposase IS116/IS110/IS902 family protein [Sporomusa ovata DSM 2662]|uniref:Mobile element protein n=1 Tax=Sporomusa ovata TaxID=2378 RepID=A0A0U1L066_9FIRM|nr:transposase IS116/IS110/IS902 family protein [Sporomusa ovata DSM 2662]CQR73057.1 Mobile element protein [Sporomusa ovata]